MPFIRVILSDLYISPTHTSKVVNRSVGLMVRTSACKSEDQVSSPVQGIPRTSKIVFVVAWFGSRLWEVRASMLDCLTRYCVTSYGVMSGVFCSDRCNMAAWTRPVTRQHVICTQTHWLPTHVLLTLLSTVQPWTQPYTHIRTLCTKG